MCIIAAQQYSIDRKYSSTCKFERLHKNVMHVFEGNAEIKSHTKYDITSRKEMYHSFFRKNMKESLYHHFKKMSYFLL